MRRRAAAILLALCMALTLLPTVAFATEEDGAAPPVEQPAQQEEKQEGQQEQQPEETPEQPEESAQQPEEQPEAKPEPQLEAEGENTPVLLNEGSTATVTTETELTAALAGTAETIKLTADIDISDVLTVTRTVTLDLNGHVLRLKDNPDSSVIEVKNGGTLTLTDSDSAAVHKFAPNEDGLWVLDETNGTKTVTGGVITGGSTGLGGGVRLYEGGTLTMAGGNIVGCRANSQGGGVYVAGGTFTMNGGTIAGCVANFSVGVGENQGGGVYVCNGREKDDDRNLPEIDFGVFTMNGGSIIDCAARDGMGGSVFVTNATRCSDYNGRFIMNGGSISDCGVANRDDCNTIYNIGTFIANGGTVTNSGSGAYNYALYSLGIFQTEQGKSGTEFFGAAYNGFNGDGFDGGIFNGKVLNYARISGGVFKSEVINDSYGTITGGTFHGTVTNRGGVITGGTFNGTVDNEGTITGGTFNGTVTGTPALATGSGTESDPYLIYSAEGLKAFRDIVNSTNPAACAKLMNDIVLNDGTFDENGNYTPGSSGKAAEKWTPIAYSGPFTIFTNISLYYTGTFDGQGHTIHGLYVSVGNGSSIEDQVCLGLFSTAKNAVIRNVTVTGYVFGFAGYLGGIAGYIAGGTVENCANHCTVKSTLAVTEGPTSVGGIVGAADSNSVIRDCYNTGTITVDTFVQWNSTGGIAGYNVSEVSNCYNVGKVAGNGWYNGEIVGYNADDENGNPSAVNNCYYLDGTGLNAVGKENGSVTNTESKTAAEFADGTVLALLIHGRDDSDHPWNSECKYLAVAGRTMPVFKTQTGDAHTHKQSSGWEADETHHWQVCACGAEFHKAEHNGGTATCTAKAECTTCGNKYGNALGHDFTVQQHDGDNHWKKCSRCDEIADKSHHDWDSGKVTTRATCTTAGEKTYTCDECGATKTERIDASGHNWKSEWESDATHHWHECANGCNEKGAYAEHADTDKNHICDICGKTLSECADTDKDHKCDYCGKVLSECADDNKDHKCDYCGKKLTDHTGGTADCCRKAMCDYCGKAYGGLDPDNHTDLKHFPAKSANRMHEGNIEYWYCSGCGKYFKDADATIEITREDTVIPKVKRENGSSTPAEDTTGKTDKNDKTVKSQNTGDAGVALYGVMALLSLTGGAWIVGKKRK